MSQTGMPQSDAAMLRESASQRGHSGHDVTSPRSGLDPNVTDPASAVRLSYVSAVGSGQSDDDGLGPFAWALGLL